MTSRQVSALIVEDVPLQQLDHRQPSSTNAPSLPSGERSNDDKSSNQTPRRSLAIEANDDVPVVHPKGLVQAILVISACLALLLVEMDQQVLATAIPAITDTFHTTTDISWFSSTSRLAICSFQFMFGKLYRTYPLKTIFLTTLAVFEIGSAICGAAAH